jgi:hypothetical protein
MFIRGAKFPGSSNKVHHNFSKVIDGVQRGTQPQKIFCTNKREIFYFLSFFQKAISIMALSSKDSAFGR